MRRSRFLRRLHLRPIKAFLLLAVFLSAGTSLPSLDAVVYHSAAELDRSQSHVEPAGGCLSHSDHCSLGRTAPGSGANVTPITEVRAETGSRPSRPVSRQSLFSADLTGNPNSRAPPVLLV
ncbi:MAG TPA: hypothetical protein VNO19_07815 [Gemmatimonadales bacterium]|nr:hypothetical protein [Gemmatimonadales bacterium]